ncbi:MAG: plasmid stabilization protein [Methylococcus sp.]
MEIDKMLQNIFQSGEGPMASMILAEVTPNEADLQQNPMATIATGHGTSLAILDHGQPLFYCLPAAAYESLLDRVEDLELNALADARLCDGQPIVKVSLDE